MPPRISLYNVAAAHQPFLAELTRDFLRIVASGHYVLGPELTRFEQEFSRLTGARHTIGVNSGTDALWLGLTAIGIKTGDQVITSPFTFVATVEAIVRTGATPVFVDVEPETLCLSPAACARAVTDCTRAILVVHVFGHSTDMDALYELCRRHSLTLIEDACQAIGARWRNHMLGTLGKLGAFSFYPTKNLGAVGDGGAIVTNDSQIAAKALALRNHGRNNTAHSQEAGWNSRLDELQAAFLLRQLPQLPEQTARRREIAERYIRNLPQAVRVIQGHPGCASNWHQFAIICRQRDELRAALLAAGIETGIYYPRPVYAEPAMARYAPAVPLAVCEQACRQVLTLPIHPALTDDEQTRIIDTIRKFFRE